MTPAPYPVHGAGLGLRRSFLSTLAERPPEQVDFYEIAPENWIGMGGVNARRLRALTERHPFVCHGLSLSIGAPTTLDLHFVRQIKAFLDEHGIRAYTEHLSYCSEDGHLYDLLPIPFTEEAVRHVAGRVRQVQEILERRIALENVSYYGAPGQEMSEIEFITAVLTEADCDLLLDVNNIHVIAAELGHPDPDQVIAFGAGLMEDLRTKGVLLGTTCCARRRHPAPTRGSRSRSCPLSGSSRRHCRCRRGLADAAGIDTLRPVLKNVGRRLLASSMGSLLSTLIP